MARGDAPAEGEEREEGLTSRARQEEHRRRPQRQQQVPHECQQHRAEDCLKLIRNPKAGTRAALSGSAAKPVLANVLRAHLPALAGKWDRRSLVVPMSVTPPRP